MLERLYFNIWSEWNGSKGVESNVIEPKYDFNLAHSKAAVRASILRNMYV